VALLASGQQVYLRLIGINFLIAFCTSSARGSSIISQIMGAATLASIARLRHHLHVAVKSAARHQVPSRRGLKAHRESEGVASDIITTLVFAAVGAFVAAGWLQKPRFAPKIQTAEEAATTNKKIA
jgi:hypothetical protein